MQKDMEKLTTDFANVLLDLNDLSEQYGDKSIEVVRCIKSNQTVFESFDFDINFLTKEIKQHGYKQTFDKYIHK